MSLAGRPTLCAHNALGPRHTCLCPLQASNGRPAYMCWLCEHRILGLHSFLEGPYPWQAAAMLVNHPCSSAGSQPKVKLYEVLTHHEQYAGHHDQGVQQPGQLSCQQKAWQSIYHIFTPYILQELIATTGIAVKATNKTIRRICFFVPSVNNEWHFVFLHLSAGQHWRQRRKEGR